MQPIIDRLDDEIEGITGFLEGEAQQLDYYDLRSILSKLQILAHRLQAHCDELKFIGLLKQSKGFPESGFTREFHLEDIYTAPAFTEVNISRGEPRSC
jgi:hypothetical protein